MTMSAEASLHRGRSVTSNTVASPSTNAINIDRNASTNAKPTEQSMQGAHPATEREMEPTRLPLPAETAFTSALREEKPLCAANSRKRPITEAYLMLECRYKRARNNMGQMEETADTMRGLARKYKGEELGSFIESHVQLMEADFVRYKEGMLQMENKFERCKNSMRSYTNQLLSNHRGFRCFLEGYTLSNSGPKSRMTNPKADLANSSSSSHWGEMKGNGRTRSPRKEPVGAAKSSQAHALEMEDETGAKAAAPGFTGEGTCEGTGWPNTAAPTPMQMLNQDPYTTLAIQTKIAAYLGVPADSSLEDYRGLAQKLGSENGS